VDSGTYDPATNTLWTTGILRFESRRRARGDNLYSNSCSLSIRRRENSNGIFSFQHDAMTMMHAGAVMVDQGDGT